MGGGGREGRGAAQGSSMEVDEEATVEIRRGRKRGRTRQAGHQETRLLRRAAAPWASAARQDGVN